MTKNVSYVNVSTYWYGLHPIWQNKVFVCTYTFFCFFFSSILKVNGGSQVIGIRTASQSCMNTGKKGQNLKRGKPKETYFEDADRKVEKINLLLS